jgi:hypothetical protein
MRFSHLGFTLFDGINDRVLSEEAKDYIFPTVNPDVADITTIDFNWMPVAWSAQTIYPPMYVCAVPIGKSNGILTQLFCFDLVLKCWAGMVSLPFGVGTISQARPAGGTAVTLLGTYDDGCLHRWCAGDITWASSIDTPGPSQVQWSVETPEAFIKEADNARFYCKELVTRGKINSTSTTFQASLTIQDEAQITADSGLYQIGATGLFTAHTAVQQSGVSIHAIISGSGPIEIDSFLWQPMDPTDPTVPPRIT